jgi:hypothetical protein
MRASKEPYAGIDKDIDGGMHTGLLDTAQAYNAHGIAMPRGIW